MKPNTLLIIPPAPYMTSDRAFPPLGILYVGTYLEKNNIPVKILDLTGESKWLDIFKREFSKNIPSYMGITATTPDMPIVMRILKEAKKKSKNTKFIIGGPHATISPETCHDFDSIVIGDGFKASLKAFSPNREKIIKEPLEKNLDTIPFPDRELIDINKYSYYINGRKSTNIMTHLGCPYNCIFCCGRKTEYYKYVRYRSPENVIAEMDILNAKYGYKAFVFYDDEFNLNRNYVLKLCKLLKNKNYIWRAPIRANLVDEEMVKRMKEAGCVEVTVGVESGSDKVLKICKKQTTAKINSYARELFSKYSIKFKAFVVIGLPKASIEDEKLTEKWLLENKPDSVDININTPYPSTEQYEKKEKYGLKFKYNFFKQTISYKFDPQKYDAFSSNSLMSKSEILKMREKILKKVNRKLK
jgi:radical SAM superfamily enzyme YgiQ (UPF0313 family)